MDRAVGCVCNAGPDNLQLVIGWFKKDGPSSQTKASKLIILFELLIGRRKVEEHFGQLGS